MFVAGIKVQFFQLAFHVIYDWTINGRDRTIARHNLSRDHKYINDLQPQFSFFCFHSRSGAEDERRLLKFVEMYGGLFLFYLSKRRKKQNQSTANAVRRVRNRTSSVSSLLIRNFLWSKTLVRVVDGSRLRISVAFISGSLHVCDQLKSKDWYQLTIQFTIKTEG